MNRLPWLLILAFAAPFHGRAGTPARINHEGRLLGPAPAVTAPTLFNTPAADAILAAMQIFPVTNPWNEDISRRPLLGNSAAMIARITADLAANRRTLRPFYEMNFILVPDGQAPLPINFFNYPDESDPAPYPIPDNLPVETWPRGTGNLTLAQWQQDVNNAGGDRHAIIIQPGAGGLWETWLTRRDPAANPPWQASNGARFNLNANTLRPAGWTSGDAAGLPMFPALVRYDECQRGMVEHALRLVVKRTRLGPIYPATHAASVGSITDPDVPAMGQRLRLKVTFTIPAGWTQEERAVCAALKKHGAIVADNGGFFSVSVCPDDRFAANAFDHLSTITLDNFEVIQTTGPTEGPRSTGAPTADAGPDGTAVASTPVALGGSVVGGTGNVAVRWKQLSGPGVVVFSDTTQQAPAATFPVAGDYVLLFSADDGTHAVAYNAVTIHVFATPREAWRAEHFGTDANNPAIAGDLADPNGNGVVNLLEYAFHTDPLAMGLPVLPAVSRTPDGMTLQIAFPRLASPTDVAYAVEAANDLTSGAWSTIASLPAGATAWTGGATVSETGTGVTRSVVAQDTVTLNTTRRFLRLQVSASD